VDRQADRQVDQKILERFTRDLNREWMLRLVVANGGVAAVKVQVVVVAAVVHRPHHRDREFKYLAV